MSSYKSSEKSIIFIGYVYINIRFDDYIDY